MIMGNDEFILHIRKHYPQCQLRTDNLGKRIYQWIHQADPNARIVEENATCYWGSEGDFVSDHKLPKTAAQISFDPNILPQLFNFLNDLGNQNE